MAHAHPVTPVRTYIAVFVGLLICTGLTVLVASKDLGELNTTVALTVALTKATLVIWYFMGVRNNTPLTKVAAISGFVWLLILFGMGMTDYISRPWLGVPGR
jgi:cytochrome c oxidase subunit 4